MDPNPPLPNVDSIDRRIHHVGWRSSEPTGSNTLRCEMHVDAGAITSGVGLCSALAVVNKSFRSRRGS